MRKIEYLVTVYTDSEVPTSIEIAEKVQKVDQVVGGYVTVKSISKELKFSTMMSKIEQMKEKCRSWWTPMEKGNP